MTDKAIEGINVQMPRARSGSSRETEWVVTPWRRVHRRQDVARQSRTPSGNGLSTAISQLQPPSLDANKRQKLEEGVERLIGEMCFEEISHACTEMEDARVCVLAFEMSGGHFVGAARNNDLPSVRYYLTGARQTESFPDCKYNDAKELYEVELVETLGKQPKRIVYMCNTGGDFAKLETDSSTHSGQAEFSFQCVELHANGSEDSQIRPYFHNVRDFEEIVVNIGMLCLRERP